MRKKLTTRFMSAILCMATILLAACGTTAQENGMPVIKGVQISPDGGMIAFMFCDTNKKRCGTGLLDLKTNKLTRILNPPGKDIIDPSFSPDGKMLAAALFCGMPCPKEERGSQIVVFDLATMEMRQVTEGRGEKLKKSATSGVRLYPVFQPGTDNILYATRALYSDGDVFFRGLNIVDMTTRSEKVLIDPDDGFALAIYRSSFVGPDKVIFHAIGPKNKELIQAAEEQYDSRLGLGLLPYSLELGSKPYLIPPFPELKQGKLGERKIHDNIDLTASKEGKRLAFIYLSSIIPEEIGRGFNLEIYVREEGKVRQVTNLRSHMAWSHISYDGRFVVFCADETRRTNFDAFVLEIDTGQVKPTGLRARLADNPAFQFEE